MNTAPSPFVSVLCLSKDPVLLETRARILQSCGHFVEVTQFTAEAMQKLSRNAFDFVVICHTVKEADRETLLQTVSGFDRRTRVICLYRGTHGMTGSAEWVDIAEPEDLVKAVSLQTISFVPPAQTAQKAPMPGAGAKTMLPDA